MNIFLVLVLFFTGSKCANILIVYETARRSHQIWIGELANALIKKGHNITMGGSFSRAMEEGEHYHPITFEGIFLTHYKFNKTEHLNATALERLYLNYNYNYAICNRTYQSNGFKSLWNYPHNFTFDLILMDLTFGPCLYPLIERFGMPNTIGFTPSALTPYLSEMFGNSAHPFYFNSLLLGSSSLNTFSDRLKSFLITKLEILFKNTWEVRSFENLANTLLNGTFIFKKLQNRISLLLVNEHPVLNEPKALTPNIIPVGGMHIKIAEPLPDILKMIVDNANQGMVFVTLGTDVQMNIFTKESKETIGNALMRLTQKSVIWKEKLTEEDRLFPDKLSNIFIHKWMPQNDLLGHIHTKLLLTTGGTLSIQEAIFHGVPVVGIPIYDEHHKNIQFIVDNKLGLKLDYYNLTEEKVFLAVNEVLQNQEFFHNMGKIAKKFRDQPSSPLQKALYWVEYALRYNDTKVADSLTPKSRYLCSFIVYYDVVTFLVLFVVVFVLFIFIIILNCLLRQCKPIKRRPVKKRKTQ